MSRKTFLLSVLVVVIISTGLIFFFWGKNNSPSTALTKSLVPKNVEPSDTFIDYTDPSGFSFSYPDNLSLSNTAVSDDSVNIADPDTYASLQLFSKDKSGSLNVKIKDSKFKTLDEWLKSENIPETNVPTEKKLGSLKALEVKTGDRLMLASLDQGVLFTIDMPLIEQDFWLKVYNKVAKDFAFAAPASADAQTVTGSSDEVIFEGEEVVE